MTRGIRNGRGGGANRRCRAPDHAGLHAPGPHLARLRPVHLHADGFDIRGDIGGAPHRRCHPDEDHVLVRCARPAPGGGASFALDAYAFVDGPATSDPVLYDFLTGTDVDLYGAWAGLRGLPAQERGTYNSRPTAVRPRAHGVDEADFGVPCHSRTRQNG